MFHIVWSTDTIFEKLAAEIGRLNLKKQPLHTMPLRLGISCRVCLLFLIILVVTCTLCLDYRAILDFPKYWSDSCRRYNLKDVRWCAGEDVVS